MRATVFNKTANDSEKKIIQRMLILNLIPSSRQTTTYILPNAIQRQEIMTGLQPPMVFLLRNRGQ